MSEPKIETVSLLIGNSDDKLSQSDWRDFNNAINNKVKCCASEIHFCGFSDPISEHQNSCWVFELSIDLKEQFKNEITGIRIQYDQDAAAIIFGNTLFI